MLLFRQAILKRYYIGDKDMGLFDIFTGIFNGVEDVMIFAANQHAKQVDNMTDQEVEKRFSKSADEVRMRAETLQMQSEILQMGKEQRMMENEIRRMKQEHYMNE